VVYTLLPQGVCEGPALIFYTALKRTLIPFIRDTLSPQPMPDKIADDEVNNKCLIEIRLPDIS
jgi:hypothetical protein